MPSKKLTKEKRQELKGKRKRGNQSSLILYLTVLIIAVVAIAAAVMFLMPEDDEEKEKDSSPEDIILDYFPPQANFDYFSVEINSSNNSINVLNNDKIYHNNLSAISVDKPENGNATILDNKIVYNPDKNFSGYDIFTYTIKDSGNLTDSSYISVYVYEKGKKNEANPLAFIETSMGMITLELYEDIVPNTVQNFINYANDGFYDGLVFHRVIDDFMVQGGGFYSNGTKKNTNDPIDLEIDESVRHVDGAIAMARTNDPNSATSQFYICDGAQSFLDDNYAAFGVTIDGINIVRSIASVETTTKYNMQNWPVDDVIINSIKVVEA